MTATRPVNTSLAATLVTVAALALGVAPASPSEARTPVSREAARRAAIATLIGDPYGQTAAAVSRTIVGQQLIVDDYCHTTKRVWKFHVVLRPSATLPDGADGYLVLDAATGKLVCTGLPLLD